MLKKVEVKVPGESGACVLTSKGHRIWERLELFCIVEGERLGVLRVQEKKAAKHQDRKGRGESSRQNEEACHDAIPF